MKSKLIFFLFVLVAASTVQANPPTDLGALLCSNDIKGAYRGDPSTSIFVLGGDLKGDAYIEYFAGKGDDPNEPYLYDVDSSDFIHWKVALLAESVTGHVMELVIEIVPYGEKCPTWFFNPKSTRNQFCATGKVRLDGVVIDDNLQCGGHEEN